MAVSSNVLCLSSGADIVVVLFCFGSLSDLVSFCGKDGNIENR